MTILTILPYWLIGCTVLAILNAKFWAICSDTEDREAEDAKARNIAPVIPQTPIPMRRKVSYVIDWAILITIIVLLFS